MKSILFTIQLFLLSTIVFAQKEYRLQGTMGTIPIYMSIDDYSNEEPNDDQNLMGRYFYQSSLKDIVLRGNLIKVNRTYKLVVESGVDAVSETFTLRKRGEGFEGTWVSKGKTLPVVLTPIDIDNITNPYDNIDFIKKLKSENAYDYARSSFIKLNRDSVSQMADKSIIWFSEKHCAAPFFRLGNGFEKSQVATINRVLDEIHFENIMNQLSCSSDWHYSEGDGIEYTTSIDYLDKDLIGFEIFSSWYCGGAHPDFGGVGYLLDLHTGKSYRLEDIYTIDSETIYNLINEQQDFQKPTSDDDYCDYTDLQYWDSPRWTISKEGFNFTPFFYRAARSCEESFLVPFSKLRPYKKRDFPYNF